MPEANKDVAGKMARDEILRGIVDTSVEPMAAIQLRGQGQVDMVLNVSYDDLCAAVSRDEWLQVDTFIWVGQTQSEIERFRRMVRCEEVIAVMEVTESWWNGVVTDIATRAAQAKLHLPQGPGMN